MQYVGAALIVAAGLVIATILMVFLNGAPRRRDEQALSLLQNQVAESIRQAAQQAESLRQTLQESVQRLTLQVNHGLADTNKVVGDRLDNAARVIGDVRQQLGQLEKSSLRMIELGQDISKLGDILRPPKLRGSLGELFLADLLAQVLPANHFELQHRFKGGEAVDAVVTLSAGMVPIDAKFPLDNFRRVIDANNDEERTAARRAFVKDVKAHIDAIARKYIRTDEGTMDFALMYVPAENVYYETIIKDETFGVDMEIGGYALKKRVVPVSPNSLYGYLQTIVLGLKGMQVEERSREILDNLSRLRKEFENFSEAFRLVGQHLDNSVKKFAEAEKRFGKVEAKVEQIDGLAKGLDASGGIDLPA